MPKIFSTQLKIESTVLDTQRRITYLIETIVEKVLVIISIYNDTCYCFVNTENSNSF